MGHHISQLCVLFRRHFEFFTSPVLGRDLRIPNIWRKYFGDSPRCIDLPDPGCAPNLCLTCTYFDLIAIFDKKARSATLFHYKSWLCNLVNSFLSVMSYRLSQSFVVLCFLLRKFYASFADGAAEQGFLAFYRSLPEVRDNLIMLVLNFV